MARPRRDAGTPLLPTGSWDALTPGTLSAGAELDGVRLTGDLRGLRAPDVRLLECELADAAADDARLRGGSWAECRWARVGATSLDLAGTTLRDTTWEGCRIGVLELPEATLTRVLLRDCKLDYVNLRHAAVTDLTVERCTIGELDVGQARLLRVRFSGCTVGSIALSGSRSEHVDVSDAGLLRLEGLDSLRGVTLSAEQAHDLAPALIKHLGGIIAQPNKADEAAR